MRFVHTADWHLGRIFHGVSLLEDQAHALAQVVEIAAAEKVDAVVVAGDVFDRAVPPPDAVALLDDTWHQLVIGLEIPVLVIAGNHDSPERIELGGRVSARAGLHVSGALRQAPMVVGLDDEHGRVHFVLLPYAEPGVVRHAFARARGVPGLGSAETVHKPGPALTHMVRRAAATVEGARRVVVAHGSVAGTAAVESERPLSVGVGSAAAVEAFDGFVYAALGHHHRPQSLRPDVRYPGSLLKYSFSEAQDQKGVTVVEVDAQGAVETTHVPLTPLRDVRIIEGAFAALLADDAEVGARDDLLRIVLSDEVPVLDPMGRLRERFENLLEVSQARLARPPAAASVPVVPGRLSDVQLFEAFFEDVLGKEMTKQQKELLASVVERVEQSRREAST